MLVLKRTRGQRFMIFVPGHEPITVTMIGDHRVGIEAPREMRVYRDELLAADGRPRAVPVAPECHP